MALRSRMPTFVFAGALLGLIVLLAALQYRWLGQISAAERERMQANLASRTTAFAQDFDREITRAYLTFQLDPIHEDENLAARLAERHDGWIGTSRHPRLIGEVFVASRGADDRLSLQRYNPATRFIEPAEWPQKLAGIREQLDREAPPASGGTLLVRTVPALWESVPALVVPAPVFLLSAADMPGGRSGALDVRMRPGTRHTILVFDREYLTSEMLPALAQRHFRGVDEEIEYRMAVVSDAGAETIYSTAGGAQSGGTASADASAGMFQVRLQEFGDVASEVRRMTTFVARTREVTVLGNEQRRRAELRQMVLPPDAGSRTTTFRLKESPPVSIMLQQPIGGVSDHKALESMAASAANARFALNSPRWKLVVQHPSGSLEAAVTSARRRNLLVSSGILAILGVSIGFLVVSTRRAQNLARQQMEFVAAVSHELRTPLAVIRSAADNLADGVVSEGGQVRKYGELVRGEGRRLTEMVEQILELSGIHSGQRGFALRPVALLPLVHEVIRASEPLVRDAHIEVEYDIPDGLPPVLGDEPALRRVVQNLVGNAIKYGASGGWIGLRARSTGREVQLTVEDRGIGIEAADQTHIFEPFYRAPGVVQAQIQGAGLGLSLVQRIVEAHGGRIAVRSAPGEGSAFTVHLPAASEEAVTRTAAATDPAHRLS